MFAHMIKAQLRWLLMWVLVLSSSLAPAIAQVDSRPRFEVASVKKRDRGLPPGRNVTANGVVETTGTVAALVFGAYGIEPARVVGFPDWAMTDQFEISARTAPDTGRAQILEMVQSLLADRFGLTMHLEQRPLRHYDLKHLSPAVALGPHLRKVDDCTSPAPRPPVPKGMTFLGGGCGLMQTVRLMVSGPIQMVVIDKTGLAGTFAYELFIPTDEPRDLGIAVSTMQRVLREQWGLTLELSDEPVDVFVIDSLAMPSSN